MADGFRVDLNALGDAVSGINDTLTEVQAHNVAAINCVSAAYGHNTLATTMADFCDRWQLGVTHLATDVQNVADTLNNCLQAYEENETALTTTFQGTGPDPAAGQ